MIRRLDHKGDFTMSEIKCPHCGQAFTVDEAGYAAILEQVRTAELENELTQRIKMIREADRNEMELELSKVTSARDNEIARLNERIENMESAKELAIKTEVSKVINEKDNELSQLRMKINQLESGTEIAVNNAVNQQKEIYEKKLEDDRSELLEKNNEINRLNADIEKSKLESELAIRNAVSEIEKQRDTQKAEYEARIRMQQESIEYYKDLKTRMSTKMIGETLELHCENAFNMIRSTAFRNAEFCKDNTVADGTKGDYIYREKDDMGTEIISIMFEMKNEMDTTSTKHKNEDFFAKLDKDRKNKKCEYAVLVSMLESDSELYNQGIVDVSYEYEKMYVIRPQFFIPMITILRNAALNSMEYKRQLIEVRNQEIDITNFEDKIESFKNAFSKNYELAGKQFGTAIEEIDKTIDHLQKVKDNLLRSENNLRLANNKAQEQLTIKALTKNNPTMTEMFRSIAKDGSADGAVKEQEGQTE